MAVISIRAAIGVYGFLMLLTAWQAWQKKQGDVRLDQLTALAAAIIPDKFSALTVLLIGLLALSTVTWFNGVAVYGKPHVNHHIIRLLVHLVLFGLAVWLF
ncbi:hypothetical protein I3F57_00130 [Lacticaseibacillus paracasei subsp. tolerans]|uniref:hypothetical protein n=1 Tax=Lacticaseibacillus paracasei TaxID=1597 RepID=UPI0018AD586D|nr:hypothetical protein [Lacticaseibacillus paracasei]QPI88247.1 hypothetical protein I3F57_00130 [Lacticaseibacillus paracasei subsp. tolerans]